MRSRRLGSFIAISGLSATALYAAQPPISSSVQSDGFYNTALGESAGNLASSGTLTTGSYNTYVGYQVTGTGFENCTTRIGVQNAAATAFMAGIYNTLLAGNAMVVTSDGQLGVASVSSERFKTDVAEMGGNSNRLEQLRPVTFRLKTDTSGTMQYGLIAEEVARVYPELVIRDRNGRIDGVRYDELAPMLLNEMQKEHEHAVAQDAAIAAQGKVIEDLKQQPSELKDPKQEPPAARSR